MNNAVVDLSTETPKRCAICSANGPDIFERIDETYYADKLGENHKQHKNICDNCFDRTWERRFRESYIVSALFPEWLEDWGAESGRDSLTIDCDTPERALHLVSDWMSISPDCASLITNGKMFARCIRDGVLPKTSSVRVYYKNIRALVEALDGRTPEEILAEASWITTDGIEHRHDQFADV